MGRNAYSGSHAPRFEERRMMFANVPIIELRITVARLNNFAHGVTV